PRAGNGDKAGLSWACDERENENAPALPAAARPKMKDRLQMSHMFLSPVAVSILVDVERYEERVGIATIVRAVRAQGRYHRPAKPFWLTDCCIIHCLATYVSKRF